MLIRSLELSLVITNTPSLLSKEGEDRIFCVSASPQLFSAQKNPVKVAHFVVAYSESLQQLVGVQLWENT